MRSRQTDSLSPIWRPLHLACTITKPEADAMLADLCKHFGTRGTAQLLGIGGIMAAQLAFHGCRSNFSKRTVWLTWCLLFAPERIATVWDLATWGRFAKSRKVKKLLKNVPEIPEDFSI